MISFLREWINQIIVAVIIATILEIIIPNGNNKKYIKMVIGIYVLFTIIEPITSKVFGKNIDILDFDYSKYFDNSKETSVATNFEDSNSKLIEQTYISNIKNDIISKIKEKGYNVENCDIKIINNENNDEYGKISDLSLKINKINTDKETKVENITIGIDKIKIENYISSQENKKETTVSEKDIKELKEYLSTEYSISVQNLDITN